MDYETLLQLLRDLDVITLLEVCELDDDSDALVTALYDYILDNGDMIEAHLLGDDYYGEG